MNLMHSWLTSKPTLQPSTRLHLKDIDQNSLKRLFRQLSRALQPWKELYISSACAQATFVLTAQVCSLTFHITCCLGVVPSLHASHWVWTMCCCHLAACKAVIQRSASMQVAKTIPHSVVVHVGAVYRSPVYKEECSSLRFPKADLCTGRCATCCPSCAQGCSR